MGDAVQLADLSSLTLFVERLREGNDLVVGNRFLGGIRPGAMPALHRYVGNPRTSSRVGRRFFHVAIGDFHCGLRGFRRSSLLALDLRTSGMEFASEVIVKAQLAGQRITEVPTVLHPDGRTRKPHLRSFRDGWRHLRFLLVYSPRWLYLYPGIVLFVLGITLGGTIVVGPMYVGSVGLDLGGLIYAASFTVIGYQAIVFRGIDEGVCGACWPLAGRVPVSTIAPFASS